MPAMRPHTGRFVTGEAVRRWLLIAWLAAANGVDAARTWEVLPLVPEANPLVAPFAHSLWLLVAKAAALFALCAVNAVLSRKPSSGETRMFEKGLWLASGWYLAVLAWHVRGGA